MDIYIKVIGTVMVILFILIGLILEKIHNDIAEQDKIIKELSEIIKGQFELIDILIKKLKDKEEDKNV